MVPQFKKSRVFHDVTAGSLKYRISFKALKSENFFVAEGLKLK